MSDNVATDAAKCLYERREVKRGFFFLSCPCMKMILLNVMRN
jgi:hypothetical protein